MCEVLNFILGHLTETARDDDTLDVSDDDFFMSGSSSDEEADEWTDKSAKYGSQPTALRHCRCFYPATCYHAMMLSLMYMRS
jgi:hypothetical protein